MSSEKPFLDRIGNQNKLTGKYAPTAGGRAEADLEKGEAVPHKPAAVQRGINSDFSDGGGDVEAWLIVLGG